MNYLEAYKHIHAGRMLMDSKGNCIKLNNTASNMESLNVQDFSWCSQYTQHFLLEPSEIYTLISYDDAKYYRNSKIPKGCND